MLARRPALCWHMEKQREGKRREEKRSAWGDEGEIRWGKSMGADGASEKSPGGRGGGEEEGQRVGERTGGRKAKREGKREEERERAGGREQLSLSLSLSLSVSLSRSREISLCLSVWFSGALSLARSRSLSLWLSRSASASASAPASGSGRSPLSLSRSLAASSLLEVNPSPPSLSLLLYPLSTLQHHTPARKRGSSFSLSLFCCFSCSTSLLSSFLSLRFRFYLLSLPFSLHVVLSPLLRPGVFLWYSALISLFSFLPPSSPPPSSLSPVFRLSLAAQPLLILPSSLFSLYLSLSIPP